MIQFRALPRFPFTFLLFCALWILNPFAQTSHIALAQTTPSSGTESVCPEPEARQFDFWIGDWDVTNRYFVNNSQWVSAGVATNQVHSILNGCAIVEHWSGNLGRSQVRGFSVRTYDPEKGNWVLLLSWPGPNQASYSFLEGSFRHGRGEFFRENISAGGDSITTRYTFSDITAESLRWDSATSPDDGRTWATNWIMEFDRRDVRTAAPVFNAPSHSLHRCTQAEARDLDDLFGTWETFGMQPKSPGAVSLQYMPILEGCGAMQMMNVFTESGTFKAFLFLSPVPEGDAWTAFLLSTQDRSFVELAGSWTSDSTVSFESEAGHLLRYDVTEAGRMNLTASMPGLPDLETDAWSLVRR